MFGREKKYDRTTVLAEAEKARLKGRRKKAITEYKKVLAVDPKDSVVHGKIAPLLAETGDVAQALRSFQLAADAHLKQGFIDRAISVNVQATTYFPRNDTLWLEVARLHMERARKADAVKVLLEGHRHFKKKRAMRPTSVKLLQRAIELDPMHVEASIALARLLKSEGRRDEAMAVLEKLTRTIRGPALKRIRRAQFGIKPNLGGLWRWLRGS
jgi:predicted Zn-dependent protease